MKMVYEISNVCLIRLVTLQGALIGISYITRMKLDARKLILSRYMAFCLYVIAAPVAKISGLNSLVFSCFFIMKSRCNLSYFL